MRGGDERSGSLFSYVDLEARVGKDHPLRTIRIVVNAPLAGLSGEFSALYSPVGRPSKRPQGLFSQCCALDNAVHWSRKALDQTVNTADNPLREN